MIKDGERLAKQAEVRAATIGQIMVGAMRASRIRAGQLPSPTIPLTPEHFAILDRLLSTGLPANLGGTNNPAELLERIRNMGPPYSYEAPGPPETPAGVGPTFPGGGGGGTGGGVASPAQ